MLVTFDILHTSMILTEILAPVEIMRFTEGDAYGPLIGPDDLFTRWSMKIDREQRFEVCLAVSMGSNISMTYTIIMVH